MAVTVSGVIADNTDSALSLNHLPDGFSAVVIGASGGIGRALVRLLAANPRCARVLAVSRSSPPSFDGEVATAQADVTDPASLQACAESLEQPVHLLIYAVGILHGPDGMAPEKSLADVKAQTMQQAMAVNAVGAMHAAQAFTPQMAGKWKSVMGFVSARVGSIEDNRLGGWYAYRASKAALNQCVRTLAVEQGRGRKGSICVALHPGTVDTGLSKPFQRNVPDGKLFTPEQSAKHMLGVIGRLESSDNGCFFAWDGQPIPW